MTRTAESLIGRRSEVAELTAIIDRAIAGSGSVVLVAGEPGAGKSRLLDECVQVGTSRDCGVVRARCWDGQGALPLSVWRDAIGAIAADDSEPAAELAEALGYGASVGLLGDVDHAGARARLFARVGDVVHSVAVEQRLLLFLDDLQWADRSSLEVLSRVAAQCSSSPIVVIAAFRDTEVSAALEAVLAALPCDTRRLTLAPLECGDVAVLARTLSRSTITDDQVAALVAHTAGNPFLVGELVRLIDDTGTLTAGDLPLGVRHLLQRRLDMLSNRCVAVLASAAVVSGHFDAELLAETTATDIEHVTEMLDEAVAARIVVETADYRFAFVHDLFRQLLYDSLGPSSRRRVHRAVGEAIERRHAGAADVRVAELAHHFLAAAPVVDPAKAAAYARRAGQRAAELLAFDDAVDYFRRAVDVHPGASASARLWLLISLGDAMWRAGDLAGARDVVTGAAELARLLGDAAALANAALVYAGGLGGNQPLASADRTLIALLGDALDRLPVTDSALRCRLLSRLAVELYLTDERQRRRQASDEAVAMARRLGDDSCLATALYALQMATLGPDGLDERRAATDEILGLAVKSGDLELALWGHLFRVWVLTAQCLPTDQELALCAQLADELGLAGYKAEVALRRAVNAYVGGELGRVDELLAIVAAGEANDLAASSTRSALVALDYALKGPYEELAALTEGMLVACPDKTMWQPALVTVYIELGRLDDARTRFEELVATGFDFPRDALWLNAMYCVGCASFVLDRGDCADVLGELIAPYADQAPVGAFGTMATPMGLIEAAAGRFDSAIELLDRAIERNTAVGNRAYAMLTRRELAAVLLRRAELGDRQRAVEMLTALRAELVAIGFDGLVARTDALLEVATSTVAVPVDGVAAAVELRREGRAWLATFGSNTTLLPSTKGIADLAALVSRPRTEIAAVDLAGSVVTGDTGALIDELARQQLTARLVDIDADLAEAESFADLGRAEQLRSEQEQIVGELTAATGLGGRARRTGDARERARKAVTWRIRHAIKQVAGVDPNLARHLDRTVKTGTFCVYAP